MPDPTLPFTELHWEASCRLVPSRFPPVSLYDRVTDPADLSVVYAIEMLTNPRCRQELGELSLVPESDRVSGPGTTPIMAAFTHLNAMGSRFSDGTYGVYYAANNLETAVAEVSHHRALFLGYTHEAAIELDLRNYVATVRATLVDIRQKRSERAELYLPNDYNPSQSFARPLREAGDDGVVYTSVRRPAGECVALFKPRAIVPPVRQGEHLSLVWDGTRISGWYRKSGHQAVMPPLETEGIPPQPED